MLRVVAVLRRVLERAGRIHKGLERIHPLVLASPLAQEMGAGKAVRAALALAGMTEIGKTLVLIIPLPEKKREIGKRMIAPGFFPSEGVTNALISTFSGLVPEATPLAHLAPTAQTVMLKEKAARKINIKRVRSVAGRMSTKKRLLSHPQMISWPSSSALASA